jgi:hypothetical protein
MPTVTLTERRTKVQGSGELLYARALNARGIRHDVVACWKTTVVSLAMSLFAAQ